MRDIGPNVRCIPAKRSEDEVFFIRAAQGRVLSVIQRRTGTHVGGHRNTEAQVEMLKPSQKGSYGCLVDFDACIIVLWIVVDVYVK